MILYTWSLLMLSQINMMRCTVEIHFVLESLLHLSLLLTCIVASFSSLQYQWLYRTMATWLSYCIAVKLYWWLVRNFMRIYQIYLVEVAERVLALHVFTAVFLELQNFLAFSINNSNFLDLRKKIKSKALIWCFRLKYHINLSAN